MTRIFAGLRPRVRGATEFDMVNETEQTTTGINPRLCACHCCGLVQILPELDANQTAVCDRCNTPLKQARSARNRWTVALAAAALAFYPPAMLLPMLRIERLGHAREDSLVSGIIGLWSQGYWFIGTLVFAVSVVLPPVKLIILLVLASAASVARHHHRARLYRVVELLGRWGMLDVLLVAILIAFVKLGDLVNMYPGKGLGAFALLVLLSLLAGAAFNPLLMWNSAEEKDL